MEHFNMKSILQSIVLISATLLIASCDSGKSVSGPDPVPDPPSQDLTVSGTTAKGLVAGGVVNVHPIVNGVVGSSVGSGTSGGGGSYSISIPQQNAGDNPYIVTVTSTTGTTLRCDLAAGCDVGGGTAFGSDIDISGDTGFSLNAIVPDINRTDINSSTTINVSGLSDLAASIVGTNAPTPAQINRAGGNVLGLVQLLTGVDFTGYKLHEIPLYDVTSPDASAGSLPAAAHAAAAANASTMGLLNSADPTADTVSEALGKLKQQITSSGDGDVTMSGTNLAALATNISAVLAQARTALLAAGVPANVVDTAVQNSSDNAVVLALFGDNDVTVTAPPAPDLGDPVVTPKEYTKRFVEKLTQVINSIQRTTGAQGFGGTTDGATETFAAELNAAEPLTSGPATVAWNQLETIAIEAAAGLEPGGSDVDDDVTDDGVSGTIALSEDGSTLTITDVTSVSGDVTITIGSGERVVTAGTAQAVESASISLNDVVMVTVSEGSTVQTFSGDAEVTFAAESGNLGLKTLMLSGTVTGADAATSFGAEVTATGITGATSGEVSGAAVDGAYTIEFSFADTTADDLTVKAHGTIGSTTQGFVVTAPSPTETSNNVVYVSVTRSSTGDVDVLTDQTVDLTLTLAHSQDTGAMELVSGVFTLKSSGAQTATIDDKGVVTYNDGTIQLLPAGVF
jgi:hypothetical protein